MLKSPDPSEAALAERISWVRGAAPDRFASLELQLPLAAVLPHPGTAMEAVRAAVDAGDPFLSMLASKFALDALADSPMVLAGSPAAMADKLARLQQSHGIGSVMIPMPQLEPLAPVIAELADAAA